MTLYAWLVVGWTAVSLPLGVILGCAISRINSAPAPTPECGDGLTEADVGRVRRP